MRRQFPPRIEYLITRPTEILVPKKSTGSEQMRNILSAPPSIKVRVIHGFRLKT
jgi:hypothetical protein